ncbi:MAG: hypothetical protein QNJ70_04165 [Xenococcaceae cyanobacterium MO_207.B15]|nr:hypothetical protein [Xenococcaceae cyanobacterium MO_207.B15]
MTISKDSKQKSKTKLLNQNPLADIAGKFGGKFWLETQSEIRRSRERDGSRGENPAPPERI